jgi:hypothetical protein
MTLVVQWWFFVPFDTRGRVLYSLSGNHPQCQIIACSKTQEGSARYYDSWQRSEIHLVVGVTLFLFFGFSLPSRRFSPFGISCLCLERANAPVFWRLNSGMLAQRKTLICTRSSKFARKNAWRCVLVSPREHEVREKFTRISRGVRSPLHNLLLPLRHRHRGNMTSKLDP